jgi:hypothetical protein
MRLAGPQVWSGQFVEDMYLLPLLGIRPQFLGCPARSLVLHNPSSLYLLRNSETKNVKFRNQALSEGLIVVA